MAPNNTSKMHNKLTCTLQNNQNIVSKISISYVPFFSTIDFLFKSITACNISRCQVFSLFQYTQPSSDWSLLKTSVTYLSFCTYLSVSPNRPHFTSRIIIGCYLIPQEPPLQLKYRHLAFPKSICSPCWPCTNPKHQSGPKDPRNHPQFTSQPKNLEQT